MYKVEWCEWNEIINETFVPLIDNKDRYIICKGGAVQVNQMQLLRNLFTVV